MTSDGLSFEIYMSVIAPVILFITSSTISMIMYRRFSNLKRYIGYDIYSVVFLSVAFFAPIYVNLIDVYVMSATLSSKIAISVACFLEGALVPFCVAKLPLSPYSIVETKKCESIDKSCPSLRG